MLVSNILSIFILGLIGGANPGPILISSCTESLKGFSRGLKVIWWALFAESVVAAFILVVIFSLNPPQWIFYLISIIGGLFLFYIAYLVARIKKVDASNVEIFTGRRIFILTLLNGSFWLFWITICVPLANELAEYIAYAPLIFLLIFEIGWLIATIAIVFIFSRFRNFLVQNNKIRWFYIIMSLVLFYLAVKMIIMSLIYFFK